MSLLKFSILLAGSIFVGALFLLQIYATRVANSQDVAASHSREVVAAGPAVEDRLRRLVFRIYQTSGQDRAMADLLASKDIKIQIKSSPSPNSPSSSTPAKAPAGNSKL